MPVRGCLHLKSAVTLVAPDTLLLNPDQVDGAAFGSWRQDRGATPAEPAGANAPAAWERP